MDAWAVACAASASSAVIYVPPGTYVVKNIVFSSQGHCSSSDGKDDKGTNSGTSVTFRIDGKLVPPSDYKVIAQSDKWISFEGVKGVTIAGGTLDAGGAAVWDCKLKASSSTDNNICIQGATSLTFTNSKDVVINGLRSINSQMFHIVINGCERVNVRGVMISAPGNSPNTDGIHVQMSTGVTIMSSGIKTGDDCISIGPGTKNLWMESIACGPGHGISIGSLAKELNEAGVENVTLRTAAFTGTQNGLRIKAWGRPSKGYVKGVLFQQATMNDVENPILIDQNYCPHDENCPNQVSGVKISDVRYQDIHGTSATQVAVKFDCSDKNPCTAIRLENVKLTYDQGLPAQSSCVNANGSAFGVVDPASCL
ncbi:hypothetical protein Sjap_009581 [Stephania japonica]|uniref:Polygalacturonase n=1 Tax=Stephania japonica TaxID=461633 RepID=A0AAP0JRQ9_9MAGN